MEKRSIKNTSRIELLIVVKKQAAGNLDKTGRYVEITLPLCSNSHAK